MDSSRLELVREPTPVDGVGINLVNLTISAVDCHLACLVAIAMKDSNPEAIIQFDLPRGSHR